MISRERSEGKVPGERPGNAADPFILVAKARGHLFF